MIELAPMLATVIGAAADNTQAPGGLGKMLPMLLLIGVFFWLIVLRPQKKEKDARRRQLESLKKGDKVVTIGGIHGKVTEVNTGQDVVTIEIAPKVPMKLNRGAISKVNPKAEGGSDQSNSDLGGQNT